jgi:tetratricopeptide (TPR) repeat protein
MKITNIKFVKFASRCLSICLLTTIGTIDSIIYTSNIPIFAQSSNDSQRLEASELYSAGLNLIVAKKFPEAIATLNRSLLLYQKLGDRTSEGKNILAIGLAYRSTKEFSKALDLCQQALKIAQELSDKTEIEKALLLSLNIWLDEGIDELN